MFRRGDRDWERVGKIRLPETVLFEDYSGIAVAGDRIAVVSQQSSALWLGHLAPGSWEVTDAGTSSALQVVMVSDKAKPDQDRRCRAKDQSIHVFRIPVTVSEP